MPKLGLPLGQGLGSRLGASFGSPSGGVIPGTILFSLLAPGSTETTAYAGTDITAVTGQALTVTGNAGRTMEDESGVVYSVSANKPRVVSRSGVKMLLVEVAAANSCLQSSTLSNASWTKSNMTCVKNATGPTGVANSATTCTATASDATVLQSITLSSAARTLTCRLKRVSGSGTVSLTLDGGSTWIDVTASLRSDRYVRMTPDLYPSLSVTITDPTVGMKLGTSGDVVEAAFFQCEPGLTIAHYSSDIETTTSATNRGNESVTITNPLASISPVPTKFFLAATGTPYTTGQVWTYSTNKGIMSLGAYAAANTLGFIIPSSGRMQVSTVDVSSGTAALVSNPPSPITAGTRTLVHARTGAKAANHFIDGVSYPPAASGSGTGLITTQGANCFIGGTSASAAFQGYLSDIKIGIGNYPPRPL